MHNGMTLWLEMSVFVKLVKHSNAKVPLSGAAAAIFAYALYVAVMHGLAVMNLEDWLQIINCYQSLSTSALMNAVKTARGSRPIF